ncbi:patatin [Myxococcus llanfairpwllgwyngyllgogerychwyrndrobwllllantysiliogogogochensis]|uniref:Patatin n=1 Tax=Myxococcus llanfairpwllgwyngyllgogerychwyrndrobwllllantysiliogogogochensis TaxID=2590453 RepID=A0A540WK16_9BACT|nr:MULTISPECIES: patatin-like phospholipase family protein [Myxococcus]NTX16989.1 patatin-like phospholipase family protein [Myxococcus sp. CA056]TQF09362.1 patatin [Myxococcus llanfairpwllgwyngyllgogerychwyrndrobwllllantysiliogogogochensis]
MTDRPATLVLSGGGGKGAFQVGAERVLREVHGFRWERVFGVSVGALNAAVIAQNEYERLTNLWMNLRESDVYRKFPWLVVALRLGVLNKLGFYDNTPLRDLVERNLVGRPFAIPAHVGRVSLTSGLYELVSSDASDFIPAVWQSATMPVIWEPIGPQAIVDGGLRNVTPLGDALGYAPTEIVVIACSSSRIEPMRYPSNILDVARRSLTDITLNEILMNDVDVFVRINDMVRQAHEQGTTLLAPDGKPYVYCRITVIEPTAPMGDTLDFSPEMTRMRIRHGEDRARAIMRPTGVGPGERMPPRIAAQLEPVLHS